jgi:hypothetical protein
MGYAIANEAKDLIFQTSKPTEHSSILLVDHADIIDEILNRRNILIQLTEENKLDVQPYGIIQAKIGLGKYYFETADGASHNISLIETKAIGVAFINSWLMGYFRVHTSLEIPSMATSSISGSQVREAGVILGNMNRYGALGYLKPAVGINAFESKLFYTAQPLPFLEPRKGILIGGSKELNSDRTFKYSIFRDIKQYWYQKAYYAVKVQYHTTLGAYPIMLGTAYDGPAIRIGRNVPYIQHWLMRNGQVYYDFHAHPFAIKGDCIISHTEDPVSTLRHWSAFVDTEFSFHFKWHTIDSKVIVDYRKALNTQHISNVSSQLIMGVKIGFAMIGINSCNFFRPHQEAIKPTQLFFLFQF